MKIVLFSCPENRIGEIELLDEMAAQSIDYIVLRKPNMDSDSLIAFTEQLSNRTLAKLIVSDINIFSQFKVKGFHFKRAFLNQSSQKKINEIKELAKARQQIISVSCHQKEDFILRGQDYDIVFVSPVFVTISKVSNNTNWKLSELKNLFSNKTKKGNYFALGGVNNTNISKLKEIGFDGLGILGYIWTNQNEPLMQLNKLVLACQ